MHLFWLKVCRCTQSEPLIHAQRLTADKARSRRSKLNGFASPHRLVWDERCTFFFFELFLLPLVGSARLATATGDDWSWDTTGGRNLSVWSLRGREQSKCLSGPDLQAVLLSCAVVVFINKLFASKKLNSICKRNEEVLFFFKSWFPDWLGFSLLVLISHSSPTHPSLTLEPQGSQLGFLSGCLLSGSEASSNCGLLPVSPRHGDAHCPLPSSLAAVCRPRVPGGARQ